MVLSFNKARCLFPHGHAKILAILDKVMLLDDVCKTPLYRWSRSYSILAATVLAVINFFQCLQLCLMYPEKSPRSVKSVLNIGSVPGCSMFKVVLHDIQMLSLAIAVESNLVLLTDLFQSNYDSLLSYFGVTAAILILKLALTIIKFVISSSDAMATEFIFQMMQVFILIFNWSQITCMIYSYYNSCLFVNKYTPS